MRGKLWAFLLCGGLALGAASAAAVTVDLGTLQQHDDADWSYDGANLLVVKRDGVILRGGPAYISIQVEDGVTVTLRDVSIGSPEDYPVIDILGSGTLLLERGNNIAGRTGGTKGCAGIRVPWGKTLTLQAAPGAHLMASGGVDATGAGGAGIGGDKGQQAGRIVIEGGDISAQGGNPNSGAAGIGGGAGGAGGDVDITGGSVSARGGIGGAGIGGGAGGAGGRLAVRGGTVIAAAGTGGVGIGGAGIGGGEGGAGGDVDITGGSITAMGGTGGAGIGGGGNGAGGFVRIDAQSGLSAPQVIAQGGAGGAGIGAGQATAGARDGGSLVLTGGSVWAWAGANAVDIGGSGGGTTALTLDGAAARLVLQTGRLAAAGPPVYARNEGILGYNRPSGVFVNGAVEDGRAGADYGSGATPPSYAGTWRYGYWNIRPGQVYGYTVAFGLHYLGDDAAQEGVIDAAYGKFFDAAGGAPIVGVSVNGRMLRYGADYQAREGSTVIALLPGYLNGLAVGTYPITVHFADGDAPGRFQVAARDGTGTVPPTGDGGRMGLYLGLLGIAGAAALARLGRKPRPFAPPDR